MQKDEETDVRKVTFSMSRRSRDFFNLLKKYKTSVSRSIKLVFKFQKLPLIDKNLGLKMVINWGPVQ